MLRKLRLRFVAVTMSIVTVILLIIFTLVYQSTRQNLETQSLEMLYSVTLIAENPMRPGKGGPQVNNPFFSLRQEEGVWVADQEGMYDLSDEAYLQELAAAVEDDGGENGVLTEYGLRYCRIITPQGRQIAFADITGEQKTLRMLVESCLTIGIMSFALFLGISVLLARWAVKPVAIAWQQQKQFVADASHELKTPLTVIQTSTELLRQTEDPAEQNRFTENILEMSHRMRQLLEELLTLARADNRQTLQNISNVNISRIVSEAILPFEPVFFEAGLLLTSHVDEDICLRGDGSKLRQMLDILLDNARKYSREGGETVVSLQKCGKCAVLQVSNPASPMTAQQCRDVFKRFCRMDTARTGGDSFGLGLPIAESIVQQHEGKIYAFYQNGLFAVRAEIPMKE